MTDTTNVLVVMSDQHNPRVLGCSGHPMVSTPNLDALAARGTRFGSAYCPSPICVPSRAGFATGRYVHQTGYWDNAMGYDGRVTGWGHVLQEAGRRVESIGKLHYRRESDPTGFDRQHLAMHLKDGVGQVWGSVRRPLPRRENASLMVSFSGPGESDYTRYDRAVTERACRWLHESAGGEPWVLYVGLVAPHFPYVAPERFFSLYDPDQMPEAKLRPERGQRRHPWVQTFADTLVGLDSANSDEERRRCSAAYLALVSSLDANVGAILSALDDSGQAGRTTVVYTSDHGDLVGSRGLWGKSLLYEESAGIPLILAGPGIPAGRVCSTPASLVDARPTILDGAGVADREAGLPGRSLLDLARSPDQPERVAFSEYHAMGAPSGAFLVRKGRYKLHYYVGYDPELFDLEADPEETEDLGHLPEWQDVRRELTEELHRIVDPVRTDQRARADQDALVERFGGPAAAATIGTPAQTPVPEEVLP